ncbi:helix-turn-helix transcriptional regulator [Pseudoalteromonas sp. MMG005]|uniref:helix-turn-helix domain-containing protein n=1 Tax=Pseudoalteromonas sp. MMG005 TaxID=2822682 RepID=UPI001B3A5C99|nr:helix-turn-helix transcriptional regulator [Pseudoalteromonas sp. MMG005]
MLDGNDLKSIRKNAGISQTEMAKKLDCDRKTVINYEQGVCELKTSQLFRWLSICKIDLKPLAAQLQNIKNSVFVIFAIAYLSSEFMMSLYISLLVLLLTFGVIRKNIVIATSTSILLFMNLIEYYTFLFLMDFLSSLGNKTPWHSSLIFIAQAVISFSIIFLLMYQNNIVRLPLFKP